MELNEAIEKAIDFINEVQSNTAEDIPTIIWDRDTKWIEPLLEGIKNSINKNIIKQKLDNAKYIIEHRGTRRSGTFKKYYKNIGRTEVLEELLKEE